MEKIKPILETRNLVKTYKQGGKEIVAVHQVNLGVERGEFLAIVGPSGSGKTTLLMLLAGLIRPDGGNVIINNAEITNLGLNEMALFRRKFIGMVFQRFNLIPFLDALENTMIPLYPSRINDKELKEKAEALLQAVGLEDRMDHRPPQLSGGEQQRVAIARALINDPILVLADEPTSELDSETGKEIVSLMKKLNKERGTTLIMATHDTAIIGEADKILQMKDGRIIGSTPDKK